MKNEIDWIAIMCFGVPAVYFTFLVVWVIIHA